MGLQNWDLQSYVLNLYADILLSINFPLPEAVLGLGEGVVLATAPVDFLGTLVSSILSLWPLRTAFSSLNILIVSVMDLSFCISSLLRLGLDPRPLIVPEDDR